MRTRVKSGLVAGLSLFMFGFNGVPSAVGAARLSATTSIANPLASTAAPGAARLGTTSYPIPSNAHFVAPGGNDRGPGTQAAPWATLSHAVGSAPNNSTIVMRGGTYREAVVLTSKALTIQPYPNEAVIVRGSNVVTGFVKTGDDYVLNNWKYQFPRQNPRTLASDHPLANAPDEVFVDGNELTQVANAKAVTAHSFYVNYSAHQLVIGIPPTGHTIEASTKMVGLHLERASGTVVRGIQFDQYATPVNTHGAVLDSSGGAVFENDIFVDNAAAGLSVQGPGTLVTQDTFADNGQLGLQAYQADRLHVTASEMKHNNVEGFNEHQEAGGMKASSSNDVMVDHNLADDNIGKGIWFDIASLRATIVRNEAFGNQTEGIQFEISSTAVIAGNVLWRNGGGGVRVIESQHVDVYNNVFYLNLDSINVWEGSRPQNVADITIRNNIMMDGSPGASEMLDVWDTTHHLTGAQMGVTTDADAFCRSSGKPGQVVAWAVGKSGQARYATLSSFAHATGSDAHGISCDGSSAAKMLTNAAAGNFALPTGSPGVNAGVALPSGVAHALQVSAGVPVNLGLLGTGVVHGQGPTITEQPESTTVLVGHTWSMSAAADGTPRPDVQWQVSTDGVTFKSIPGATTNHISGVAVPSDNNKRFRAVFTNSGGVSISDAATLIVSSTNITVVDPGTHVWGEPLTLYANATLSGVPQADVGGSVTFFDNSDKLGTRAVYAGVAALPVPHLDAGGHDIVAVYTILHTTVTSDPTVVEITKAATGTVVRANHRTIAQGADLTIAGKADVLDPSVGRVDDGTISFYDNGTLLATVDVLTTGRAVLDTTDLDVGTHVLTATYDGDGANYQPSPVSLPITVTVR